MTDSRRPATDSTPARSGKLLPQHGQRGRLGDHIRAGESWLVTRIIEYAKAQDYTRYTSTLEEAWRVSICELSAALIDALGSSRNVTDFTPDESFDDDPISAFAILEAGRHRERGISLPMFLGLFKYYRQTYLDWLRAAAWPTDDEAQAVAFVARLFDRWEIAFCSAWAEMTGDDQLSELQDSNREITNEKNRFLTVTESLGSPVILFDENHHITYCNRAAAPLLGLPPRPGTVYYSGDDQEIPAPEWLMKLVKASANEERRSEKALPLDGDERIFEARIRPMLDVSDKFEGTVVVFHDITALRHAELALTERAKRHERLAITDPLTGIFNRRGFLTMAEKQFALSLRTNQPLSVLFLDVDDLKGINDEFGHTTGDSALVAMAEALKKSCRAADTIARIGGDEFVVLLSDREADARFVIKDRIAAKLSSALAASGLEIEIGFSTGWAQLDPARHESFEQLLGEADAAMYSMKRGRRTRHAK